MAGGRTSSPRRRGWPRAGCAKATHGLGALRLAGAEPAAGCPTRRGPALGCVPWGWRVPVLFAALGSLATLSHVVSRTSTQTTTPALTFSLPLTPGARPGPISPGEPTAKLLQTGTLFWLKPSKHQSIPARGARHGEATGNAVPSKGSQCHCPSLL